MVVALKHEQGKISLKLGFSDIYIKALNSASREVHEKCCLFWSAAGNKLFKDGSNVRDLKKQTKNKNVEMLQWFYEHSYLAK